MLRIKTGLYLYIFKDLHHALIVKTITFSLKLLINFSFSMSMDLQVICITLALEIFDFQRYLS